MKTNITLFGLVLILGSIGMGSSALASTNKYVDFQTKMGITRGNMGTPAPKLAQHNNKYTRALAEKSGLGGTVLPNFAGAEGYNFKLCHHVR